MGEHVKGVSKILERFGSKILILFTISELLITSLIWVTDEIPFGLGFGNIFLLNLFVLVPYMVNLFINLKEPDKQEYIIIIDFYSSIVIWGISLVMEFTEYNSRSFYLIISYLGYFISIIYFLLYSRPKSRTSNIQFYIPFIMVCISTITLSYALLSSQAFLPLPAIWSQILVSIIYLIFFAGFLWLLIRSFLLK